MQADMQTHKRADEVCTLPHEKRNTQNDHKHIMTRCLHVELGRAR